MGEEVLAAGVAPRRYRHGDVVVGQGQAVTCLRLVVSGAVRLSAVVPSGREVVVGLLGAGDVFGELALLGGGPSPVEARAVGSETRIVALPLEALREVVRRAPASAEELLRLPAPPPPPPPPAPRRGAAAPRAPPRTTAQPLPPRSPRGSRRS